jgi:hypothetical protein
MDRSERVKGLLQQYGHRLMRGAARATGVDMALRHFADRVGRACAEWMLEFDDRLDAEAERAAVEPNGAVKHGLQDRKFADYVAYSCAQRVLHVEKRRKRIDQIASVDRGVQILLSMKYRDLLRDRQPLPSFSDVQLRSYSQNGEDGILLYIFSLIGHTDKRVVELCVGDGIECNAANLIINHRWVGLLFDGSVDNIEVAKQFYTQNQDTHWLQPTLVPAWITTENVNSLITSNGFSGEIDLLSLDLDGVDYWIWKTLDCISPRVIVLEYNWMWGAERAVTIPNRPDHVWSNADDTRPYFGASLPAFVKLGREKGYRLIGCEEWGFNAFFMRNDVGREIFPEIDAAKCFEVPMQRRVRQLGLNQSEVLKLMSESPLEWVAV